MTKIWINGTTHYLSQNKCIFYINIFQQKDQVNSQVRKKQINFRTKKSIVNIGQNIILYNKVTIICELWILVKSAKKNEI